MNRELLDKFAQSVIEKAKENGEWEIRPHVRDDGITVQFTRSILREDLHVPFDKLGYYFLFDHVNYDPVYVGYGQVGQRVYRFFKELNDMSRSDEDHSAARRYRYDTTQKTIKTTRWYGFVVWQDDLEEVPEEILSIADERIAEILKSRYNRKTIGNSLPI